MDKSQVRVAVEKALVAHKAAVGADKACHDSRLRFETARTEYRQAVKELESVLGPSTSGVLYGDLLVRVSDGFQELDIMPVVNPVDLSAGEPNHRRVLGIGGDQGDCEPTVVR